MVGVGALRTLSDLGARIGLAVKAGLTFGGKRDVYAVCGFKEKLTIADYRARYRRNGLAATVVETYPLATWRGGAELIEDENPDRTTKFERAWDELEQRLNIWATLARLDVLAGLGRYAVLVVGLPGDLAQEPVAVGPDRLAYLTVLAEDDAKVLTLVTDPEDERFGLPLMYEVRRLAGEKDKITRKVHAARVIHVADGVLDDRIYGTPRLERVWNDFDNLEKVTGGGAEAFWRRADQGLHLNIDPDKELDQAEIDKLKEGVEAYAHGLQRTIGTVGAELNVLGSDVANFSAPVDAIITLIAGAAKIPKRILVGSERGELASSQDKTN